MYVLASELGEQRWGLLNMEHSTAGGGRIVSRWVFKRQTSEPLVIDNRRNDVGVGVTVHSHIIPLWKTL